MREDPMRVVLIAIVSFVLWSGACGPDIPDTIEHQGVGEEDCSDCHFGGDGTAPPESHWEEGEPSSSYDECLRCHHFE